MERAAAAIALGGLVVLLFPRPSPAAERPYMFMRPDDIAAARRNIAARDWAKRELEELESRRGRGECHRNLFRWLVLGDAKARDAERAYLLSFVGAPVNERPWSDNYENAIRYDALYGELTAAQRAAVEKTFRAHIDWQLTKDKRVYRKHNWLPNMQWCRAMGIFLMSVALGDEKLVDACFRCNGGWKYYFDDYVSDGHFYNEDFGKQSSMIGEMLLWCRGCEALGLDGLGYGYVGQPGGAASAGSGQATMRKYLESIYLVGMPRVDLGTDRPQYPKMTMGDAKGKTGFPGYAFQHPIVTGCLADGRGGDERFGGSNMNGRDHKDRIISKLMTPLWYEIAHRKWPDGHFDYWLAQMRRPGQDKYYPSLFFGCEPIDPDKVSPPAVKSLVAPQRGIAVLRAQEGPEFWQSPAPCVSLRLATTYVHEVPDCFSIIGFYAFNRPIYINRQVSSGYAGTDPGWSNSIRSHSSAMVDNLEPRRIGIVPTRQRFGKLAKFLAARGKDIYPDVEQQRALVLTDEYLLDVFALASPRTRSYLWEVQTLGHTCPDNPADWAATRQLVGSVYDLGEERSFITGGSDWAVTAYQTTAGADPCTSGLGPRWFADRYGVRVSMLGEPGTVAYTAVNPATADPRDRLDYAADEPGGATILAARNAKRTMFVALHEPWKNAARNLSLARLVERPNAVAVQVTAPTDAILTPANSDELDVGDRLFVALGEDANRPVTLDRYGQGSGESCTFRGFAFIRIRPERVEVEGDLDSLKLCVGNRKPELVVNGKRVPITVQDLFLYYHHRVPKAGPVSLFGGVGRAVRRPGPIAARWWPRTLALPSGGQSTVELKLRNCGATSANGMLTLRCAAGLSAEPNKVWMVASGQAALAPGGERSFTITIRGDPNAANQLGRVSVSGIARATAKDDEGVAQVQPAELTVANGVCAEWKQVWPRDFSWTIHAPRYLARYYYLTSVASTFLLDPAGHNRRGRGASEFPRLYRAAKDAGARGGWKYERVELGGFQAFRPVLRRDANGTGFFADMGQHPHGYRSPFEMRFTDDWIAIRWKDAREGERAAIDWWSDAERGGRAAELWPATVLYAADGKVHEARPTRGGPDIPAATELDAVFYRPAGYEFGQVCLYPKGSVADRMRVVQPGGEAMAFTFARREDFAGLVARWLNKPPPVYVKPWGQGDMGR